MDPTITGAFIGASTAMVGYIATAGVARKGAVADRQARLWDRRVELYVDTVTFVINLRLAREQQLSSIKLDPDPFEEARAGYDPPVWIVLRGRIESLASRPAKAAFEAAHRANMSVRIAVLARDGAALGDARLSAAQVIEDARLDAVGKEDGLIEIMRAELDPFAGRRTWWRRWRRP
jgi:hypothetical protein